MAIINRSGLEGHDDFLGFTFNGRHSSEFRIVRVSQNNAYSETLLPNSRDITTEIVGRDGLYYFGSSFEQRPITIDFAFDDLHEEQFNDMTQWLAAKTEGELTFDERPYKTYMGKINSTPTLNYICFNETWEEEIGSKTLDMLLGGEDSDESFISQTISNGRVYKGTGKIQFTCFYPWSYAKYKTADEYTTHGCTNVSEWQNASHILNALTVEVQTPYPVDHPAKRTYSMDEVQRVDNDVDWRNIFVYNAGQIDTPFKFLFTVATSASGYGFISFTPESIYGPSIADASEVIIIDLAQLKDTNNSKYYMLDSELHLLRECSNNDINNPQYTGKVCNYAIVAGDFFELPNYNAGYNGYGTIRLDGITTGSIQYNYRYY